jgi:type II secretion system protein N
MRRALVVAAATAVFAVVLALSFPTDELARWGLARAPLPDGRFITFERAHLRPWGLVLDGATLRRPDGNALYAADWLRLRPSLSRPPWRLAAGLLGGTVDARLGTGGGVQTVELTWTDLDLERLLAALQRGDRLAVVVHSTMRLSGRASGSTGLRLTAGNLPSGSGEIVLRDAVWQPSLGALADAPVHAEHATLRWDLADRRLSVAAFDLQGREMHLAASGHIQVAAELPASTLDLHVSLTPQPGMPEQMRQVLDGLPRGADGTRDFVLAGTLDAPRIARP